jgi:cytochrome c
MRGIRRPPLTFDDGNMLAGMNLYKEHCALCHGAPGQPRPAVSKEMFPLLPQLFENEDMVNDDPEGVTYWKVTHGIRLSGMPGFGGALSDAQRWQLTMLVTHADRPSSAAQAKFAVSSEGPRGATIPNCARRIRRPLGARCRNASQRDAVWRMACNYRNWI